VSRHTQGNQPGATPSRTSPGGGKRWLRRVSWRRCYDNEAREATPAIWIGESWSGKCVSAEVLREHAGCDTEGLNLRWSRRDVHAGPSISYIEGPASF